MIMAVLPSSNLSNASCTTFSDSASTGEFEGTKSDSLINETFSAATVDVLPEFPGGDEAMLKFLSRNLRYPMAAKRETITGHVYVSFVINEDGKAEDIRIIRSLGYGTDEEVTRVVGIMPEWKPGQYKGRKVKTAFVLPVNFALK